MTQFERKASKRIRHSEGYTKEFEYSYTNLPEEFQSIFSKEIEKINLQRKIAVVVSALFGKRLVCRRK